ncbi:MAG: hypothetical protein SFX18_19280 [Pirellulales bacterium]|nr:hypothetical protein [Pirellulales bacterium]
MTTAGISGWNTSVDGSPRGKKGEESASTSFARLLQAFGGGAAPTSESPAAGTESADPLAGVATISADPALVERYDNDLQLLRERIQEILAELNLPSDAGLTIQQSLSNNLTVTGEEPARTELETALNDDPRLQRLFQAVKSQAEQLAPSFDTEGVLPTAGLAADGSIQLPARFSLQIENNRISARVG